MQISAPLTREQRTLRSAETALLEIRRVTAGWPFPLLYYVHNRADQALRAIEKSGQKPTGV